MCSVMSEVARSSYDVLVVEKNEDMRQRIRAVIEADSELLI